MRPRILLITPARESDNNGNYHTAARWAQMLSARFEVTVSQHFGGEESDLLIALHARRSATAISAFRARNLKAPIVLALTGTDLYKDLVEHDAASIRSLQFASVWVTLQEDAPHFLAQLNLPILPNGGGRNIHVVFQSARPIPTAHKDPNVLNVAFVGHLRGEKDPQTLFEALRLIPFDVPIAVNVAGNALDSALGEEASRLASEDARFAWLGGLSHERARELIAQAHVLVVPSRMEGGANVIAEALTAGTPVIASNVSGNVGMLGADWPGFFPVGNAPALAQTLMLCLRDPGLYALLQRCANERAPLFLPENETRTINEAVDDAFAVGAFDIWQEAAP
jgi:putative glycosyltransferase (TIGR04348 family)